MKGETLRYWTLVQHRTRNMYKQRLNGRKYAN